MLARVPQAALSFSERAFHLLERIQYRRVDTEADLDAIRRLRYDSYLREGLIPPNASGRFVGDFDRRGCVYNVGLFIDGALAGALRLHIVESVGDESPTMGVFGDVLTPQLLAGRVVVDPNKFVASYDFARRYPELPYLILRPGYMACEHFGAAVVAITVRSQHQAFYRRVLFARAVSPPRPYPMVTQHTHLLFVDFAQDRQRIASRHPYWDSSEAERQALFGALPARAWQRNAAVAAG
jgi:hypothetical protein